METKRIEALAKLMEKSGLAHLELREGENELVLSRGVPAAPASVAQPVTEAPAPLAAASVPAAPTEAQEPVPGEVLTSPLVGCVYLAPAPGKSPFVQQGSAVKKGQVLCIIEAMKVMNEFLAPRDGVVAKVCVENGQLAEYGQALFYLS